MVDIPQLKEVGDEVVFDGAYMEVYIPKYYFEKGVANREGNIINTIGIFNFKIFSSEDKKDNAPIHMFNFSSFISTKPTDSYNTKITNLTENSGEMDYTVLRYFKGDLFLTSVNLIQKSDNTVTFINLLNAGKLPTNIPYHKVITTELSNLEFNGVNLKVPATVLELIISEIYRDKNDLTKAFRYRAGSSENVSMYDYKPVNIKNIATFNSTFTGITFEDLDYNITASVNKARQGKKEAISPVEKTIKY